MTASGIVNSHPPLLDFLARVSHIAPTALLLFKVLSQSYFQRDDISVQAEANFHIPACFLSTPPLFFSHAHQGYAPIGRSSIITITQKSSIKCQNSTLFPNVIHQTHSSPPHPSPSPFPNSIPRFTIRRLINTQDILPAQPQSSPKLTSQPLTPRSTPKVNPPARTLDPSDVQYEHH